MHRPTHLRSAFLTTCLLLSLWGCAADETSKGGGSGNAIGNGFGNGSAGTAGSGASGIGGGVSGTGEVVDGPTGPRIDAGSLEDCPAVSQTADNKVQPVDIIIAIDTSGSMGEEIAFVQAEMNAFSQQIVDSGIDARVILIAAEAASTTSDPNANCVVFFPGTPCVSLGGGDFGVCIGAPLGSGMCPADSKLPTYAHINQSVGSTDALNVLISSYPSWKQHLREQSVKQFLVVTDDNAESLFGAADPMGTTNTFIQQVTALEPGNPLMWASWKFNSIHCFTQCAAAASIGTVYDLLVPQTGGTRGDLCLQDFKPVFDELAKQVASSVKVACEWDIPAVPAGKTFDRGKTNVKITLGGTEEIIGNIKSAADCGTNQAWHYDVADETMAPTKVLACPALCDRIQSAPDAKVDVLFDCPTIQVAVE